MHVSSTPFCVESWTPNKTGDLAQPGILGSVTHICFKDFCERDLKLLDKDVENWEELASNCDLLYESQQWGDAKLSQAVDEKSTRWKNSPMTTSAAPSFMCSWCNKDCHSHVALHSRSGRCSSTTWNSDISSETDRCWRILGYYRHWKLLLLITPPHPPTFYSLHFYLDLQSTLLLSSQLMSVCYTAVKRAQFSIQSFRFKASNQIHQCREKMNTKNDAKLLSSMTLLCTI